MRMKFYRSLTVKVFCLICFVVLLISCSKKNSADFDSTGNLAEAYVKSQKKNASGTSTSSSSAKSSANISAIERIRFNRTNAITDNGNVPFKECRAIDVVRDMTVGWNLGNTFDATGGGGSLNSQQSWGQPYTTREIIDGLATSGIKTIRIPVSWSHHIADNSYTIDPAWMARVKEVVDWAIEDEMYVIINIHHDNYDKDSKMPAMAGFYPTEENYDNSADFVCNIWAQIALAFNNGYDEHLIFEVLNEPRLGGTKEEWWYNPASAKSIESMKTRASGGNNKKRMVAFPSLQASADSALAATFKMPKDYDDSKDRLIVSVHMYTPYSFAMESPGEREYTASVKNEFTSMFKKLNDNFIVNGYAVYIGEYGATNKYNLEDRVAWFRDFIKESRAYGMTCILWDNGVWEVKGNDYSEHYGYYNRYNQTWYFPEILEAINSELK